MNNTEKQELVSIITPTYNCGEFIAETIESVLAQTYQNWEMIVVDDCSTDNTEEIIATFLKKDHRIQYHKLKQNAGAAVARTVSMQLAKGEYMAFLDSDDLWYPQKLEKQIAYMKKNGYAFTCTKYEQIDEKSELMGKVIKVIPKTNYNRLLLDCPVGNSTVMYDVRIMGKFKVPDIKKRNDDALWLQMLKKEEYIYGIDEILMKYRVRENSISSNKFNLIKYHWYLYRNVEKLGIFRSMFHVGYWCVIKMLRIK